MINFTDWAEIDGPPIVLVLAMLVRDLVREYLKARYGSPPPPPDRAGANGK